MKRLWLVPFVVTGLVLLAGEQPKEKPKNLGEEIVKNGDFESGKETPDGWDEPNDLTVFWVTDEDGKNKVLKFDSAVLEEEVKARNEEMKKAREERPKAKVKTEPTEKQKYSTIAASYGAQIWSDYFSLKTGQSYLLTVRYKSGNPSAKVFVKGYAEFGEEKRIVYKAHLPIDPKKEDLNKWVEYWMVFTPKASNPKNEVKWGKVELMIYWPPGVAYVDDVSIRPVLEEKNHDGTGQEGKSKERK
ncbi:MAG: hypothetical protein N2234_01375 [Planctomycetota bacterium]|nr:hypothetical protein [Planctomycetota bacterium]